MRVEILKYPGDKEWREAKERALVTVGKKIKNNPSFDWKVKMLKAQHSPIRCLQFSFLIEDLPSWVSVHLCRHIHAQPYVKSQRNDRQEDYDRNSAPQNSPVDIIWDMNAEELISICHKRLCNQSSEETREVVKEISKQVKQLCPEFNDVLIPLCVYRNGICEEFNCCGYNKTYKE